MTKRKMGKYDGWLIVSDMDATLLDKNEKLSKENKEAIDYFISNGGLFTVASGRMAAEIELYFDYLHINAPAILHNGAQIYDFDAKKNLMLKCIEAERKKCIKRAHDELTGAGVEVFTDKEQVFIYRDSQETARYKLRKIEPYYGMTDEAWNSDWVKVLFIGEKEILDRIEPVYKSMYDRGYSVRSGERFLDVVADGASKGNALTELIKILGLDREKVVAVGDNMNDISMIYASGCGVAVGNAVDELKNAAQIIAPEHTKPVVKFIVEEVIDKKIATE